MVVWVTMEHSKSSESFKLLRLASIFILFGLMVTGLWFLMNPFSHDKNSIVLLPESECLPVASNVSNRTVVLRIDDIQAYAWRETSMKMITDATDRNIPITLGVIPVGMGEDTQFVNFLKNYSCKIELALHGFTHNSKKGEDVPEFASYSKKEALTRIKEGRNLMRSITTEPILSWVPPLNIQSTGTIEALSELGFTHSSAEGEGKFDMNASTYIYGSNVLVAPEKVVESCRKAFETSSYCIIMIHPQDFANGLIHNQEKYQQYYLELLDALTKEGVTFSRLKDLPL